MIAAGYPGNAIQFIREDCYARALFACPGACAACQLQCVCAGGLSRPANQDDRAPGGGERGGCRGPNRDAKNGRQYGPAVRDHEPAGRLRHDRCRAGGKGRAGWLHDRRVQRQHHDHGAEPAVQNALGHLEDFEPVSLVATVEWGLIANNQTSYKTAADLIAAAKAAPGKIDYGSGGPGSPQHLAMAMFASAAGISLTHVPYKGATQAATDVAAGQIPVGFQGLGTVAALVRGNSLKLIGVATPNRLPQFPDVPTVSESGLPGFTFNSWFAILAPAGTPKEIIARLNAEVVKAVSDPEVRRKLEELGFAVRGSSAAELRAMTRDQLAKYARVIKEMGIANE